MKNDIIEKIHSVGKVSRIVSRIAQIAALIGVVAMLVVGIMLIFVPADSIKSFDGTASGKFVLNEEKTKIFSLDDSDNEHVKFMGAEFEVNTTETVDGNIRAVDIDALAINVDGRHFKAIGILLCCAGVLYFTGLYIVFVFTVKLAKTLEMCESPFEEKVLEAMKKLGFAFIPFGIIQIGLTGVSAVVMLLMILLVVLIIHIFSYGAKLQQESDDTV